MLNDSLNFLSLLKENNNREWFAENRFGYETARDSFAEFVDQLIIQIKEFDASIGNLEPKDCIFRIFRDVRFSANKEPYKINMGAYIAKGGRKRGSAGYYFHVEPGNSFISGGIYMAPTNVMRRIREDIDLYPEDFLGIINTKKFTTTFQSLGDEKMKRIPTGFSDQSPVGEYLKLKHITPHCSLSDVDVTDSDMLNRTVEAFKTMKPLVLFINRSIDGMQET
jgi:uncharacterized protein (TIGR02453 family)